MSKRSIEGIEKRKHVALTVIQKVEILKKLDAGSSVNHVASSYGISPRTVYDIRKNKEKILSFFSKCDTSAGIAQRKTMRPAKDENMDQIIYEWFRQRRSEGVPITGPLLCEKAKHLHKELNVQEPCVYSSGWLTRFKQRHGIRYLKSCGEKLSADSDAAEEFVDEFAKLVHEENLTPEQVYNMDETGLFWKCLPRHTLTTQDDATPAGVKESKERITVVLCSNAAGTHKCKPMVIGKSAHPRALKGIKVLPVIYKSNKKAWITKDMTLEWFNNQFRKEARRHCNKVGLPSDCKILLLLDNCAAHPEIITVDNITVMFLPPNTTSLIQPMDQGIIYSLKSTYRLEFMKKLVLLNVDTNIVNEVKAHFSIKDALNLIGKSWDSVSKDTLVNGWRNLWPASLFFLSDDDDDDTEFAGFRLSEAQQKTAELLTFAKENSSTLPILETDILIEFMSSKDEISECERLTDEEIVSSVLNPYNSDTETDEENEEEAEKKSQWKRVSILGKNMLISCKNKTL